MSHSQLRRWLLIGLTLGWGWFSFPASANPMGTSQLLDPQQPRILLEGQITALEDPTSRMTFADARAAYAAGRFGLQKGSSVNVGNLSDHAAWVHFALTVTGKDSTAWWLLVAPEHINHISVFQLTESGDLIEQEGGRNLPFAQRGFPSPGHTFRLGPLPEGTRQVFLRITSDTRVKIEPSLWQEAALIGYLSGLNTGLGAYFGLVSLLWLMALARVLMYRNGWDLAYLGYLSGFELFHFMSSGLLAAWGLSDDVVLRDMLLRMSIPLTSLSFMALVRTLIVWPIRQSRWDALAWRAGPVLMMLCLIGVWCFRRPLFEEVNLLLGVGMIMVAALAGAWAAVKKYSHARVMFFCFLPFVLWIAVLVLMRYFDGFSIGAWEGQRIMMMTSIAHMFALWLLTFSKDARLQAAKLKLESEVDSLQREMSNQSLFLSLLTHEMSRPLRRLMSLVHPPDGEMSTGSSLRSRLHAVGSEMNGVIETCLDRMRQASSQTLHRQPTDIRLLVESIVSHYRQASFQRLVTSELQALPPVFDCDPKLVAILLSNLLENAFRHSAEGGSIYVGGKSIDRRTIEFQVADEGPGIPKEALETIFDRYVQLEPRATQDPGGMGLGLFIVRRIAELHGGSVACVSEVGVGTKFVVRLLSGK